MRYLIQYLAKAPGSISVLGGIYALQGAYESLGQDTASEQFLVGQAKCAGGILFAILLLWISFRMLGDSRKASLISAVAIATPLIVSVYVIIHISFELTIWTVTLGTALAFILVLTIGIWKSASSERPNRFGRFKSSWDK
jgi:hypothetical protein